MIILASQSPRRRELLAAWGISFRAVPSGYEEDNGRHLPPETLVRLQAEGKARDVWRRERGALPVLGADTLVVCGGAVLGKPVDAEEARRMLRLLSGRTHEVMTGVAVMTEKGMESALCRTDITFRPLGESEIEGYIAGGEPMDKAGAYAIQGKGKDFVKEIRGSWSNVVGLPRGVTLALLAKMGVPLTG